MKSKNDIISWSYNNKNIVLLLVSILLLVGIYGLYVMPKQEFPAFTIRQGLVVGVYPGAAVGQVEEQLTDPLEDFILSFKEVKKEKTVSQSRDGVVYITVELNDDVTDKEAFWAKFRHRLAEFKSSLPSGVLGVIVNDDFGDTSAILITLESDQKSYRELEGYLDNLKSRLRCIKAVSNLRSYGLQKEQITVLLDQERLSSYAINSTALAANLFSQGFTSLSGSVDNSLFVAPIHIQNNINAESDVSEQIIYYDPQGNVVRLKDVAKIKKEYPKADSYIRNNGKKAILLSMEMREGNNIVAFGDDVNKILKEFEKTLPEDVSIYRITDQSKVVGDSVSEFLFELLVAIIAVIVVVIVLMPFSVALVSAASIPITIFMSLALFYFFNIELNTVSLAALIVTLGMIVDNSIVIVDSYLEKIGNKIARKEAAIESAREFLKSIFSATLAISITFMPFLFTTTGTMRDFLIYFPWAVVIILFLSFLVAIMVIPYLQSVIIKKGISNTDSGKKSRFLNSMQNGYNRLINLCFNNPKQTLLYSLIVVVLGTLIIPTRPLRLMPIAERNQFAVEIYLPKGTATDVTAKVADVIEKDIKKDERVVSVTTFIGEGSPRFHMTYAPQMPGSNYAQFIVNTKSNKASVELLDKYSLKYDTIFPNARILFKQMDYGNAAYPIEVRLSGDSLSLLKQCANDVIKRIEGVEGLRHIRTNLEEPLPGVTVELNQSEMYRLGINRGAVSLTTALSFGDGVPVTTLWEGDYPINVVLKADREKDADLKDIDNELVPSWIAASSVPLRQLADVKPDWNEGQIVRRNGVRSLSVAANTDRGYNVMATLGKVKDAIADMDMPEGVSLSYGGEDETSAEMIPQLMGGLLAAVAIIFFILLFHFKKINLALLVMLAMIFCLPGTGLSVLIMNLDLTTTGLLGVVSLMGILVRNSIIMLDYARELMSQGEDIKSAAIHAAERRMRPIFLTSAAASMGVVPMIISQSELWMPMGVVIFFGTWVSMVLVLTALPVMFWLIFKKEEEKKESKRYEA